MMLIILFLNSQYLRKKRYYCRRDARDSTIAGSTSLEDMIPFTRATFATENEVPFWLLDRTQLATNWGLRMTQLAISQAVMNLSASHPGRELMERSGLCWLEGTKKTESHP